MRDAVNKAVRTIIKHCENHQINVIVFGWNKGQKQEVKGSVNSLHFTRNGILMYFSVHLPYATGTELRVRQKLKPSIVVVKLPLTHPTKQFESGLTHN
jgi:hypothetical protein